MTGTAEKVTLSRVETCGYSCIIVLMSRKAVIITFGKFALFILVLAYKVLGKHGKRQY